MKTLKISDSVLKSVYEQAEREYPHECCGLILGPSEKKETLSKVRPCRNVQNRFRETDPKNFPRTNKTAYFVNPEELLAIQKEMREAGEEIRVIYHSHIDTESFFSEEDTRLALQDGEPLYPGVQYLIVAVAQGKVQSSHLFYWDRRQGNFKK